MIVRHFDERRRPATPITLRRKPEPKTPWWKRALDLVLYTGFAFLMIFGFAVWMGWLPEPDVAPRP